MLSRLLSSFALTLLLAVSSLAQRDQSPPPPRTDSSATAPPANPLTAPAKKVWTNDDLQGGRGVSVVGDKRNQNYHMTQNADSAAVARIRKNLEKLSAQLEDTNHKLTDLKKFEAGETVHDPGRQVNKGLNRVPVDQQIAQLEASKKKLESQIGDLLDEARKKGIDPGQLR